MLLPCDGPGPQGLKPAFVAALGGTAEAVPYPKPIYETSSSKLTALLPPSSGKVEAIKVHHPAPRSHEVLHKRFLRVVTCIDFRDCLELRV